MRIETKHRSVLTLKCDTSDSCRYMLYVAREDGGLWFKTGECVEAGQVRLSRRDATRLVKFLQKQLVRR